MTDVLNAITEFADRAHGDQVRKYVNERYIEHPKRVMITCSRHTNELPVLAAALLHDVLEDTATTRDEILSFLKALIGQADADLAVKYVEELTDIYTKAKFPKFNRRTRRAKEAERLGHVSPNAQLIKYADIIDNTDVAYHDSDFAEVYLREARQLLLNMASGPTELRTLAMTRVDECILFLAKAKDHPTYN
jgi:guanosine-3',5'-bis(diphosphate) 3'-pyrophosphohydrolase